MPIRNGSSLNNFLLARAAQAAWVLLAYFIGWKASNPPPVLATFPDHSLLIGLFGTTLLLLAHLAALGRWHHSLRSMQASSHFEATLMSSWATTWLRLRHLLVGGPSPHRRDLLEEWFHSKIPNLRLQTASRWDAFLALNLPEMHSASLLTENMAIRSELQCAALYSAVDWVLWTAGIACLLHALGLSQIGSPLTIACLVLSRLAGSFTPALGGFGARELCLILLLGVSQTMVAPIASLGLLLFTMHLLIAGMGAWACSVTRSTMRERSPTRVPCKISIVIPVLNEEAALRECVRRARQIPEVGECLVVDGGSRDRTREIASELGCVVIQSAPGRGRQLRRGAERASCPILMFLHADTWLPPETGSAVQRCLADPRVVAGGLWKRFRDRPWLMIGSRPKCLLRVVFGRRIVGDMAFFVRKEDLEAVGGVPDIELMEDFELSARLRKKGRLALADATLTTSARRFVKHGVLATYLKMWRVTWLYRLGKPPSELRKIYQTCTESDSKIRSTKSG